MNPTYRNHGFRSNESSFEWNKFQWVLFGTVLVKPCIHTALALFFHRCHRVSANIVRRLGKFICRRLQGSNRTNLSTLTAVIGLLTPLTGWVFS